MKASFFWCGRKDEAPPNYGVWFLDTDSQSFAPHHIHPKDKSKSGDGSDKEIPYLVHVCMQKKIDDTLNVNSQEIPEYKKLFCEKEEEKTVVIRIDNILDTLEMGL
eukprot:7231291-Ditylum_brightwellii.AAC.1